MTSSLELLPTLKLALTQLEAASSQSGPDADSDDARPALRKWIETLREVEQADDLSIIDRSEELFLKRKGVLVVGWTSAQRVRDILDKNGFGHLSHEHSNTSMVDRMALHFPGDELRKLQEEIEQKTARDVVEEIGLNWPEPKEK